MSHAHAHVHVHACTCAWHVHVQHVHVHLHLHLHLHLHACHVHVWYLTLKPCVCVCVKLYFIYVPQNTAVLPRPRGSTRPLLTLSRLAYATLGDGLALAPCTPSPVPNDNHSARMILSDDLKCTVPPVRVEPSVTKKNLTLFL
jgi:hypothetical protein